MASRGINKVIIVGNLGQVPDKRFMPNGEAVVNFTVATSETWKDKQTGEQKEKTEWHRIVIYGRLAEIADQYLAKGSKVYLEGRLQTRKWQNQQGADQYTTEVICNEMQMLDPQNKTNNNQAQGSDPHHQGKQPRVHILMPNHPNGLMKTPYEVQEEIKKYQGLGYAVQKQQAN